MASVYPNYKAMATEPSFTDYNPVDFIGLCRSCSSAIYSNQEFANYSLGPNIRFYGGESFICKSCIPKYEGCKMCGRLGESGFLFMGICPSCIYRAPSNLIKNYTFKVEQEIPKQGDPKDLLYFGVELELESKDYEKDVFLVSTLVQNFARLKRDSSLEQGFEIVTAPCSMDVHYKVWDNFFSNLPSSVYPLKTCGMHVHVSRFRLSDLQIGKILCFLHNPDNHQFIKLLAGRRSGYHNDYVMPKKITDGANGGILPQNAERHTALNLNGEKTIEFRIFRSTKNRDELFKNIEASKALVKFTDCSLFSIQEARKWENFVKFVCECKRDYPYLDSFLKKNISKI